MENNNHSLVEPLINKGNIFKLKCEKCNSISVQITENEKPDFMCFDCGGNCSIIK